MKHSISIFLQAVTSLSAATLTENLNPALIGIAEALKENEKKIEGKEYTVDLTLKIGTDKFLIFSDAYLQNEKEESKYQIAKWIFAPEQTKHLAGKSGIICRVRFKVEEMKTDSLYSDMPHIVAKIISIEPLDI